MGSMNYAKYSARAQGVRLPDGLRQPVRRDHRAARGDERARRSSPSTSASTSATSARWRRWSTWASCTRRCTSPASWASSAAIPPTARNLAPHGRQHPRRLRTGASSASSREQWMLVAAALTLGGSVRVGLEDNFYLPDGTMARSNGDLIAKARQMTEDVGRRAATVAEARTIARGAAARGGMTGCRSTASASSTSARLLPGGFCSLLLADFGADVLKVEDTGLGDYVRWSPPHHEGVEDVGEVGAVPGAEPRQALDPHRTSRAPRRPRGAAARWSATPTSCSSRSGPACSTASASATSACARSTRRIVYCAITRLRPGRPVPRPLRARHELPRPGRAARPDAATPAARRCRPPARSPTSAAAR